jgi:tetratricopeptide (TPR) repeat protein
VRQLLETVEREARTQFDWYGRGNALRSLGTVCLLLDDRPAAEKYLRESLRQAAILGDRFLEGKTLVWLGRLLRDTDPELSQDRLRQAVNLFQDWRDRRWQAMAKTELADTFLAQGKLSEACAEAAYAYQEFLAIDQAVQAGRCLEILRACGADADVIRPPR